MNTRIVAAIALLLATSTPINTEPAATRADESPRSSILALEDRDAPEVVGHPMLDRPPWRRSDRRAEASGHAMDWEEENPMQAGEFLHTLS